jgi:uncharacterized protein YbjT (DUF2867 family)
MKILVTGASGPIGSGAVYRLLEAGHDLAALVRSDAASPSGTG